VRRSSKRALKPAVCLLVALGGLGRAGVARAEERPSLRWSEPVHCMRTPKGDIVRVQCDGPPTQRRCLVAPNEMEGGGELRHVQECSNVDDVTLYQAMISSGAKIEAAVAETPPGYARSDRGRAFQVKFDLLNRVYVGASWIPSFQKVNGGVPSPTSGSPVGLGRGQAETGFHISALSTHGRARHDFRILEGTATFKDLEINGLLFAYDYQHLHRRPAWWLTTFIGPAKVHPISPPLGWGFRVLAINDRPPAFRDTLDIEYTEVHAAWDPWQSGDLYSHVRVEAGADVGEFWEDRSKAANGLKTGVGYVGFSGAVRSRFSLGEGGLHSIQMDLLYRRPTLLAGENIGASINRVNAVFAYEGVLIAVNDQPVSVRLTATGGSRDDPAAGTRSFELGLSAGLRFSFWAPPRVFEPMQELEDP
jgi:hypothetical protein